MKRKLYGVQFHPEVDLSPGGKEMFRNFLYGVAGASGDFKMESREQRCIEEIRNTVKNKKVLVSFDDSLVSKNNVKTDLHDRGTLVMLLDFKFCKKHVAFKQISV